MLVPRPELLRPADLPALVALELAGQPHPWAEGALRQAFEDHRAQLWGVREGAGLLGYAVVYQLPFEAELQAITVAPQARRRGIARALLAGVIVQARQWGSERLLLEVRESNQAARRLYDQAGFGLDGRRRGYYCLGAGRREDALLMSLLLSADRA